MPEKKQLWRWRSSECTQPKLKRYFGKKKYVVFCKKQPKQKQGHVVASSFPSPPRTGCYFRNAAPAPLLLVSPWPLLHSHFFSWRANIQREGLLLDRHFNLHPSSAHPISLTAQWKAASSHWVTCTHMLQENWLMCIFMERFSQLPMDLLLSSFPFI